MKIRDFHIRPLLVAKDRLDPGWSWISDTNGWSGFHLWYVLQNGVKIQTEEREFRLSEGDTFLFDLSQNHHCTHDPQKPACIFTAYFHCDEAERLSRLLGDGVIPQQNHPRLFSTNMQLFEEAVRGTNTPDETAMWLAPLFHQLLSAADVPLSGHDKIAEICHQLDTQPQEHYALDELASRAGYSKNQFIRVFRRVTGTTPYAYLVNSRMARAKHLLLFSDYTVTQIAQMLGYRDLHHFSVQFYQKTGGYPSQYARRFQAGQGDR